MTNFNELNLNEKILKSLEKKGYTTPTPIQAQSIPHLLEGKDLLGIAQTGTGKTAAFSLPILDALAKNKRKLASNEIRSLILTPTRELASQIADNINLYSQGLGLSHAVIFGGVNINNQIRDLQRGVDIVIATPGRLLDLASRQSVKFGKIEIFVLDEADRMLDMGFICDVKKIIAKLPTKRQTLFFSATMAPAISTLAGKILNDPVKVEVTPQSTTVEKIDQRINLVDKASKAPLLKSILEQDDATSVLVFSKTKHGANRIVKYLDNQKIRVGAIHGNKSQAAREKALGDFKNGKTKVLIATDIAARGIDIPAISHVINFDIPHDPENYVHRIGRTARAGRKGVAISFCDFSEKHLLRVIEKTIKYQIPVDESHPFHGVKNAVAPQEFSSGRLLSRNTTRSSSSQNPKPRTQSSGRKISSNPRAKSSSSRDPKRGSSPKESYYAKGRRRKDGSDDHKKPRAKSHSSKKPYAKKEEIGGLKKFIFAFGKNKKVVDEREMTSQKNPKPKHKKSPRPSNRNAKNPSEKSSNPRKSSSNNYRKKSGNSSSKRNASASKKSGSFFSGLKKKFIGGNKGKKR